MAKTNNRPGFSNMQGSINPRLLSSVVIPNNPKKYDIWFNYKDMTIQQYDGTNWILFAPIVISDIAPANLNAVWVKPSTPP